MSSGGRVVRITGSGDDFRLSEPVRSHVGSTSGRRSSLTCLTTSSWFRAPSETSRSVQFAVSTARSESTSGRGFPTPSTSTCFVSDSPQAGRMMLSEGFGPIFRAAARSRRSSSRRCFLASRCSSLRLSSSAGIGSPLHVCGRALCAGRPGPFFVFSFFLHFARLFWNHTYTVT